MKTSYTSGEAARLCGLSPSTIKRWVDRGALKAYQTPGGNLRILQDHLLDFMRECGIPSHETPADSPPVILLAVENENTRSALVRAARQWGDALVVKIAKGDFDFGYILGQSRPAFIVLEGRSRRSLDCAEIRRVLTPETVRIGIVAPLGQRVKAGDASRPDVAATPNERSHNGHWELTFLTALLGQWARNNGNNGKGLNHDVR